MFRSAAETAFKEIEGRRKLSTQVPLSFGIEFLDDATSGIFPDDLILIGAPSGAGKTQLCCNIVLANILNGKKVNYLALEASDCEIERRLKWPFILEKYYSDPNRSRLDEKLTFPLWLRGKFLEPLAKYEEETAILFEEAFKNLRLYYKGDKFGIDELIETVHYCAHDTDLILIDHVHYFDFDDDNENRAIKEIAKTVRTLALERQKPIILVAHLRKKDRNNDELVPGLEEFHGSSDLYKIATKVVTLSPGQVTAEGCYETFFRIPKNRIDGGVTRYIAREIFSPKRGGYEKGRYELSWAGQKRSEGFELIDRSTYPSWAQGRKHNGLFSDSNPNAPWKSKA